LILVAPVTGDSEDADRTTRPRPTVGGRLARLLTTHGLLEHGYGVARYVSIEQRMFDTKNAYHAALFASQRQWHQGTHDVWPWTEYLVGILEDSYDDFESRVAARRSLAGMSKQERVREYVLHHAPVVFRLRHVRSALPGVSDPTIRLVLNELRREGLVGIDEAVGGSGPRAAWRRTT
jgi:Fic family protein